MPQFVRRSLLVQLLSVYLLFVIVVLLGGVGVDMVVEQQLQNDAQVSELALAQDIALDTSQQVHDAENALVELSSLALQARSAATTAAIFQTFQSTHSDVDHVYWLDPVGSLRGTWPQGDLGIGAEFSPTHIVEQARMATGPVLEVGIAVETTFNAGVIIAEPMRASDGHLMGIVADSLSLVELSTPLMAVEQQQQHQQRRLELSIIDNRGELIATPQRERLLQTVLDELPGAEQALHGHTVSNIATRVDGQTWLFSTVPVPAIGWAVVVQRPTSEALAIVTQFHLWLLLTVLLFVVSGLFFWLILLNRVIRPMHTLALQHQELPRSQQAIPSNATMLARRTDEIGYLARSLIRLEMDGLQKLGELQTLLETSNAVVQSLEPHAVVAQIIREARRLVDVQAAAVLLADEQGILHVLVSDGHSEHYDQTLTLAPENVGSSAVMALRDRRPVQHILGPDRPSYSYEEGFRSVLAIPIISRHTGNVVLLVQRAEPHLFNQNEVNLLETFANYATLAWEHAVLYERSDERLRVIAHENERLYRKASQEKQKLEAIMGSMIDGLVLTGSDGTILYANQGTSTIANLPGTALVHQPISTLYDALHSQALEPARCSQVLAQAASSELSEMEIEIQRNAQRRFIALRLFTVNDETQQTIGRGLLLRDVTHEREVDEFKSTLLTAVGHELRTPLAVIKGYASTLLQEDVAWSPPDQQQFLQTISSEADRLALLVSNLLDLSRQEAGLLQLRLAPASIEDLLVETLEAIEIITQDQYPNRKITLHIPADLPPVHIDSVRIGVVLHNLLTNALAYGENTVQISVEKRAETLVVSVTDDGPGIAAEELPHVFTRFYRAHHGRQQRSGGTGLGLTICKAFVEAHACHIWAESDLHGTTISFSLLLAPTSTHADIADETLCEALQGRSGSQR